MDAITWRTTHGDTVEVYVGYRWKTDEGYLDRYAYRVRAANNRIVETGSEGYTRRHAAVKAAERHHPRVSQHQHTWIDDSTFGEPGTELCIVCRDRRAAA